MMPQSNSLLWSQAIQQKSFTTFKHLFIDFRRFLYIDEYFMAEIGNKSNNSICTNRKFPRKSEIDLSALALLPKRNLKQAFDDFLELFRSAFKDSVFLQNRCEAKLHE